MATTYYPKYYYYIGGSSSLNNARPVWEERLIDFAVRNVATGDTVKMLSIPANSVVMTANYQTITTVLDATGTFVINDGTNTLVASAVAVAAGSYGLTPTIARTNTNIYYAANADIQITTVAVANLTSGQIKVMAAVIYPQMVPSYVDPDGNTKTYVYTDRNAWVTTAPVIP